jgi:hypothetical protein
MAHVKIWLWKYQKDCAFFSKWHIAIYCNNAAPQEIIIIKSAEQIVEQKRWKTIDMPTNSD